MSSDNLPASTFISPEQFIFPLQNVLHQQNLFSLCPVHAPKLLYRIHYFCIDRPTDNRRLNIVYSRL